MDIFEPGITELLDPVEVIVDGDPSCVIDAEVIMIQNVGIRGFEDYYKVQLRLLEMQDNNDDYYTYTMILEAGSNYNIWIGESDLEVATRLRDHTSRSPLKNLVGVKIKGTKQDAEAKYEAYMDPTIAALAEYPGRVLRKNKKNFIDRAWELQGLNIK
jgi:hypothetical protein